MVRHTTENLDECSKKIWFKLSRRASLKILVLRNPVLALRTPKGCVYPRLRTTGLAVRLASGASRTALSSGRPVIGGSGGAQRCDEVNVEKSGESGEEHLCTEARR